MQQGKMMTGIADACAAISAVFERVQKKLKTDGLFNEKENACIGSAFNDMLKEGNGCLDQLKKFFSLKQVMDEKEKAALLQQMHQTMRTHHATAVKFEKGFLALSDERLRRLENTNEVEQLFKVRAKKKEGTGKQKKERKLSTVN